MAPTRAAQLGIGKINQLNQLFLDLTCARTCASPRWRAGAGTFRPDVLRPSDQIPEVERQVEAALETLGLDHRADVPANVLPYGEKRRLEIGIALATGPHVLLLDEPLAGMSPAERIATRALIREHRRDAHAGHRRARYGRDLRTRRADHGAVRGRLLAEGTPEEIQAQRRRCRTPISEGFATP